jgi:predicted N-acetyltransferase YhbS
MTTMGAESMQILAADDCKDRAELYDLLAKTFSHRGYFRFRDYCRDKYVGHSHYDWRASRIGVLDGRIIAHVGVWDYPMRIATARVRTGGIGTVAMHGDYRNRGLMSRLFRATVDSMRQGGYDMSILFGIPDFYHRFGYVRAWAQTRHIVMPADLHPRGDPPRLRGFSPRARKDLDAMYNRQHATLTGTAVRPTYQRNRRPKQWRGFSWSKPSGKIAGYVVVIREAGRLICVEVCGPTEEALAALAGLARRWRATEICFDCLPHSHPIAKRVRLGSCRLEVNYSRSGGPMVRTVDLRGVLTKLSGELWRRLQNSHLAQWRGKILIADGQAKAVLTVGDAGVTVGQGAAAPHAIRGGSEIAQLLLGTDEPMEIVGTNRIRLTGRGEDLLGILMPNQHPMLNLWDGM